MENLNTEIKKDTYLANLAASAKQGDSQSYQELLLAIANMLRPFVLKNTFSKSNTEDILQSILIVIDNSLHTYSSKHCFVNWLFSISRSRIIARVSKYQDISDSDINIEDFKKSFFSQDSQKDAEDLDERIESSLDVIPEEERKLILVLKVNDYNLKVSAKEQKTSVSKAKYIAYKAYQSLQKEIG